VNSFRSLSGWLRQMRVAILPRHSDVSCQSCCYTGYQPRCHGKSCIAQPAEWTIARKRGLTVQIIVKSERRAGRQDPRRNNVEFVRCSNLPAGTAQHGAVRRSHTPNPKFPRYSQSEAALRRGHAHQHGSNSSKGTPKRHSRGGPRHLGVSTCLLTCFLLFKILPELICDSSFIHISLTDLPALISHPGHCAICRGSC